VDTSKKLAHAFLWNLIGRWGIRIIGIASSLILLRLLAPDVFGVMALATIYIGLFEVFSHAGVNRYLIASTDLKDDDLNTAWTLNLVLRFIISSLLVLSAGYIAELVNDSRIQEVIIAVAIINFFGAFGNIALIRFQKAVNYKPINTLDIYKKLLSTMVTLVTAYFYPTYWALIAGNSIAMLTGLIGGYILLPYLPEFNFQFKRALFTNSAWIYFRNIISYFRNRLDVFFVGKLFDITAVGKYKISQDFATLPFSEIIAPATRGMFPALSKYKNQKEALFDKTYKFLALVYSIIIPSIFGFFIIATQFSTVILGEKWVDVAALLPALSLLMLSYPLNGISHNLFDYFNKSHLGVINDLIGIIVLALVFCSWQFTSIEVFTQIRAYLAVLLFLILIIIIRVTLGFSLKAMCSIILVPLSASIVMYGAFTFIYVNEELTLMGLLINMFLGACYFSVAILLLIVAIKNKSTIWTFWFDKVLEVFNTLKSRILAKG
jgi:O-antigen/teichoic acid export membrane protein